ncbi:UNVERIFIED_CONTAM: hypothetical protein FKN15_035867 [Acipenser sinensis]
MDYAALSVLLEQLDSRHEAEERRREESEIMERFWISSLEDSLRKVSDARVQRTMHIVKRDSREHFMQNHLTCLKENGTGTFVAIKKRVENHFQCYTVLPPVSPDENAAKTKRTRQARDTNIFAGKSTEEKGVECVVQRSEQKTQEPAPQPSVDEHDPRLGPRPRAHNKVIQPPGGKSSVVFY